MITKVAGKLHKKQCWHNPLAAILQFCGLRLVCDHAYDYKSEFKVLTLLCKSLSFSINDIIIV